MSVLQSHQCLFSFTTPAFSLPHRLRTTRLISLYRPPDSISQFPSLSGFSRIRPDRFRLPALKKIADVAEVKEVEEEEEGDGPVELPPPSPSPFSSTNSIFATSDDPSPLQLATSVMLTGAITIFLFRSLRRRAKRSKELTFRSTGAKKSLKEEAMENLKAMGSTPIEGGKSTPSAAQAFLGAISAGVIALILYKLTLTIESSLNRQTISDNFSYDSKDVNQSKLHDYANKFWSGLLEDYYLPRATLYFNELLKSSRDKKKLEIEKWRREWIRMSHKWQQSSSEVYPVKAKGDALAISRHLLRKYFT